MNARHAGLLLVAATLLVGGCSDRKLRPLNPCTVTGVVRKVSAGGSENVDLLLMVDNSGSMESEQLALQQQLPNLARVLLTGDIDGDPATTEDQFPPVQSLRVGVITSNMGLLGVGVIPAALSTPGNPIATQGISACGDNDAPTSASDPVGDGDVEGQDEIDSAFFGDDGEIQLVSSAYAQANLTGCEATYPSFLQFDADAEPAQDRDAFVEDVACTAVLGTTGCGFEMQLESILVAVTNSEANPEIPFAPANAMGAGASRNRTGRATPGQPNANFFRPGSVIAIVAVTDEEDCSTDDPRLFMFNPTQTDLQDPAHNDFPDDFRLNTRCTHFDEELYPIQRYVDGLRALRPTDPQKIVFAGIIGLPRELENSTFDGMLADGRMTYTDRLNMDGTLRDFGEDPFIEPACWRCLVPGSEGVTDYANCPDPNGATDVHEGLQWAAPGRRYVELADRLEDEGMNAVIRSICTDDFRPAMETILRRIGDVLRGACLPRALNPDAEGRVNCDVIEILPVGDTCAARAADVGGREATPIRTETTSTGETREVCRVEQLVPTSAERTGGQSPAGIGWFYDDYTSTVGEDCGATPQRIGFVGADPVGDVRLECLQPVTGGGLTSADIFSPCSEGCDLETVAEADGFIFRYNLDRTRFISGDAVIGQPMACETTTNTCQIACGDASDCPGGYVCLEAGTTSSLNCGDPSVPCFCANPTCTVSGGGTGGGGTGGGTGGGGGDPDAG